MSPKDPKEVEEFKEGLFEAREDKFKFLLKCYRDLFCCSCNLLLISFCQFCDLGENRRKQEDHQKKEKEENQIREP